MMPAAEARPVRRSCLARAHRRLHALTSALASTPATFSAEEVAHHDSEEDCWLVIGGVVYDVTPFLRSHPGGIAIVLPYAGRDATRIFHELHDLDFLKEFGRRYVIGTLEGGPAPTEPPRGSRGLKGGGLTPRAAKLFVAEDGRGAAAAYDDDEAF